MLVLKTHVVEALSNPIRFVDYTCGVFVQLPSRNSVKKAIKKGALLLNGEKANSGKWVHQGDRIELVDLEEQKPKLYDMKLDVVFEDEHFAVINKPSGLVVNGNQFRTVENVLVGNIKPSIQEDALKWAKPVHRLDSLTSGLLIVSKTASAHIHLAKQFEEHTIQKTYMAVVVGTPADTGIIEDEIEEQQAKTTFFKEKTVPSLRNETLSLVRLMPHTGRTHQLRIHLANMGNPIVGDILYGEEGNVLKHKGLFLAAVKLELTHPFTGEQMKIVVDEPQKFHTFLEREEKRWFKLSKNVE